MFSESRNALYYSIIEWGARYRGSLRIHNEGIYHMALSASGYRDEAEAAFTKAKSYAPASNAQTDKSVAWSCNSDLLAKSAV